MAESHPAESEQRMCFSCGLFGKQAHGKNRVPDPVPHIEVTAEDRNTGKLDVSLGGSRWGAIPTCFAGIDLQYAKELHATGADNPLEAVKAILHKDRGPNGCPQWVPYKNNLDPKWHLEDSRMLQLERESARRDRRSFWAFIFIGIVGLVLAGAQIWAQLRIE